MSAFSSATSQHAIFNALPGAFLLLSAELLIEAVSDDFLVVSFADREQLIGHSIWEVFPDNPQLAGVKGTANLRALLEEVLKTGKRQQILQQRYDVADPLHTGKFLERYWRLNSRPVVDQQGRVTHIIHSVTDITEQILAERRVQQSLFREQAAYAEADLQGQQLHSILMHAPALICIFQGPDHVFKLVNPPYQQLVGKRPLLGKSIAQAMPELAGQPIFGLLDKVYRTGESFYAHEMLVQLDHENSGNELGHNYYNFIYQATRNLAGQVDGIMVFAYEVTPQVKARQQLEVSSKQIRELNEELQVINEELQASNEELISTNLELQQAQKALQELNKSLESLVAARTEALQQALRETQQQREQLREQQDRLQHILGQVPASIATLVGPEHRYNFFNDSYQALSGNRTGLGLTVAEVFPEVVEQGFIALLDQVYATGNPFRGTETPAQLYDQATGKPEQRYVDFIYQPLKNEFGQIQGILAFVVDVTEKVVVRQQAEALQTELLATAQRMVQERETFYQVFASTPAAICIHRGPEHRFEYFNAAYQALFPDRQLQGMSPAEALPEVVPAGYIALLDQVYLTGETYFGHESPLMLEQLDGKPPKEMYFTFTYQAYRENNQIVGISTFAYDVTEQVQARRQQQVQQKQLQALFEQAPVAVAIFRGLEYVVEVANTRVAALWGRTPEQVLGKAIFEALPEVRDQGFREVLDQVMHTGEPFVANEVAALLQRNDQLETVYLNFVYQPLHDEQGRVMSVAAVATDVSEQVKARQASEASTRQLRLITDALPVLIGYLDQDEKYRFANRAYENWFNRKAADLLGRPIREIAGEKAYPNIKRYIDRALAGERVDFEATMPFREDFTKHIRTSYIPDRKNGEVIGFYTLVQDITDQVEAREAIEKSEQQATALANSLLKANEQLRRVNVDLDNFIYTASHDLKAPILNIEGLMGALQDQLPAASLQSEDVAYTLHLMADSVQRFKRTIEHLTEITKLQKENSREATPIDLAALIQEVQLDLATEIQAAQAQIETDATHCPTIRFSPKNLRSIIYNLLSNALKYRSSLRAPLIRIHCAETEVYQILSVQDNGLGMDLSGKAKLFTMFKRLHNHVEGTGIGLYMVKKIMENADGKIEVESAIEQGSTFRVYFKRNQPAS